MWTSVTSPMRAKASRTVSPVDENDRLPTYRRVPMSHSSLAYGLSAPQKRSTRYLASNRPQKISTRPRWRNPPRRHVALPSIAEPRSRFERAAIAGETSVSKSKHNGPNCARKLLAHASAASRSASSRGRAGLGQDARDGLSSSSILSFWRPIGVRSWPPLRDPTRVRVGWGVRRQGMGLANFAGSGAGWSVSTFCRAITPPVGSLTMSDTTVFATL